MSGSENGRDDISQRARPASIRSASPAKRSAHEMESNDQLPSPLSDDRRTSNEQQTHFDNVIASIEHDDQMSMKDGNPADSNVNSSTAGTASSDTSATSLDAEEADTAGQGKPTRGLQGTGSSVPSIDEQVRQVRDMMQQSMTVGDRGVVVSMRWLTRVLSRTSDGLQNKDYPKEAREGSIGPFDNADIVPAGGFSEPILKDINEQDYIPLTRGLAIGIDIEVLPYDAYGLIIGWYGIVRGQKAIIRYAHDTAPAEAAQPNIQYEMYPPIFTVQKVPFFATTGKEEDKDSNRKALLELQRRKERKSRGQTSPDDALRVVSSKFQKYQIFLRKAKEYAGIPSSTKVKTWRSLKPTTNTSDDAGGSLDAAAVNAPMKLIIKTDEWDKLEVGRDIENVTLQDETSNDKYNGGSTMETFQLFEDQTLILEEQQPSSNPKSITFSSKPTASKSANTSGRSSPAPRTGVITRGRAARTGKTRGLVGLSNLGNTCYMNSALQCIRSVEELAIYFMEGKHKRDINVDNPLGYKGAMATKYAEVIKHVYSETASSAYTPQAFKRTVGQYMPTFSGFGQQDSQEFLSFLVDALHEDLNRIAKKPYLENPDSDDARVNDPAYIVELGETYRANHRARNDSIAMDLFSGFYKNTMECPVCEKVSITFDPYSALTLQLPIATTFTHSFIYVPLIGVPIVHDLDLEKNMTVRGLKELIATKHPDTEASTLWMVECYAHKLYKIFDDKATLAEAGIQKNDHIFVFELTHTPTYAPPKKEIYSSRKDNTPSMDSEQADVLVIPIIHRAPSRSGTYSPVLHPQYISLVRDEAKSYEIVLKRVLIAVAQFTNRPILMEAEEKEKKNVKRDEAKLDSNDITRVSDHSVQSEDEYVNVTLDGNVDSKETDRDTDDDMDHLPGQIPDHFEDSSYVVPKLLSTQLFRLNYYRGTDMNATSGISMLNEQNIHPMRQRVKSSRRSSVDSSSTEASMTDAATPAAEDEAELDHDEMSPTHEDVSIENSISHPAETEDELADAETTISSARAGRRKNGKSNKFKDGKKKRDKTYTKRDRKAQRKAKQMESNTSTFRSPLNSTQDDLDEDNPYYLKIGEAIVLDWHADAFEDLFHGQASDAGDVRGQWTSSEDGSNLEVFTDPTTTANRAKRAQRNKFGISLDDCFAETGKREMLSEDNAWYCNRCKELRQATKTLEIWTLPDILVLHLKRFGGNRRFNDKIDVMVDYPVENLDLEGRVGLKEEGKGYVYDLFAIDNHYGGLGGGHYTATAKNFFDGEWYDYNDSSCNRVGEAPRRSAAAYLLFYRRRSDKPLGPPALQELVARFRNPGLADNESANEDGDESDSGEGRLGDHSSTLLGSSSNSIGAGVAAMKVGSNNTNGMIAPNAVGSRGPGALKDQMPSKNLRKSDLDEDEGISMEDDSIPDVGGFQIEAPPSYGHQQPDTWSFANLDGAKSDSDTMLLDDNDSMAAAMSDEGTGMRDEEFADAEELPGSRSSPANWNDQETSFSIGQSHAYGDEALHLEDAGMVDGRVVEDHSPSPVDIKLDEK